MDFFSSSLISDTDGKGGDMQQDFNAYPLDPNVPQRHTKRHITAYYPALKWTYYALMLKIN